MSWHNSGEIPSHGDMVRMWLGIFLACLGAMAIFVLILGFCFGASLPSVGWALAVASVITIIGIVLVMVQFRLEDIDQELREQQERSTE